MEPEDDYDTPDNLTSAPAQYPPPEPYVEESYDVPDELLGGHAPSTPPPEEPEDNYDTPDTELFAPPPFKPPNIPSSKPLLNAPAYHSNSPADSHKPKNPVSELTKRFANKPMIDEPPPPTSSPTPPMSPSKPSFRKNAPTPVTKPTLAPPPLQSTRLEDQIWFKKDFNRKASEAFLRSYSIDGGFVVRPSTQEGPGNYSYSIYYQGEIRHLKIRRKAYNNKYSVGEEKENELEFDSVVECVKYHRNEPLILKAGGEVCLEILQ